ncbi:MAG: YceI family protein [Planctomycetota bacterium]|nr:MAG: YceI family protein [Planctomycetota bacterium]
MVAASPGGASKGIDMKQGLIVSLAIWAAGGAVAQDAPRTALDVKGRGLKTFYADSRVGNNQLTFFSESTLEDFTGVCNQIGGECKLDPQNLEAFSGRFFVRVRDMKTGIELRDTHMNGPDWLDSEKHPEIVVEFSRAENVKRLANDTAEMTLVGKCTIRGKTNELKIPVTLKYLDETPKTMRRVKGDLIRLRSKFSIKLSDYGVTGPKGSDVIGLKVSDKIDIRVTVFGSTERPPDALKPDANSETPARRPPPRPNQP